MFDINNKVALISGGASGIGLRYAKELLRNGLRAVTLADVNPEFGKNAVKEITNEFGANKAIFVQTDVTSYTSYEQAFEKTIETFKNLDILINNAGICNDAMWEKEVAININGVIHGMILGLENYIPNYKSGDEGVIVNMSSVAGIEESVSIPIYTATKFAVHGITRSWGNAIHYERTKVKVIALCPGVTITSMFIGMSNKNFRPGCEEISSKIRHILPTQSPEAVAVAMVKIIKNAQSGSAWVVEGGKDPYEFILPERKTFAPKEYH